jgi:hypothetical protein
VWIGTAVPYLPKTKIRISIKKYMSKGLTHEAPSQLRLLPEALGEKSLPHICEDAASRPKCPDEDPSVQK